MKKCYFVHIPKTGGSSIKTCIPGGAFLKKDRNNIYAYNGPERNSVISAFGPQGSWKHLCPAFPFFHYLIDEKEYDSAFKFSFVRNPYDRVVSSYVYQRSLILAHYTKCINENTDFIYGEDLNPGFHNIRCIKDLEELFTFDYFVRYLERVFDHNELTCDDSHYMPQIYFTHKCINENYFVKNVDFIGRFENLKQDYWKVCKFLDVEPQELPHLKKGEHDLYQEYYTDATRKIIERLYRDDLYYYGYKF